MRTMHLFAGGGGGLLGDLILGHNPIVAVEWEPYACQILRERAADGWFPDLQVWEGDVRLFDPSEYSGRVDCIHAGFPCQDISGAGKQAGLGEGTRSGLYREVLRIAGIVKPRYLFLENVSAIVNLGLGTVVADLSAMGYDCKWLTLRASDVGAPHHRDRWWCLAYSIDSADCTGRKQKGEPNKVSGISRKEGHAWLPSGTSNGAEVLAESRQSGQQAEWQGREDSCGRSSEIPDTYSPQLEGNERAERGEQEYGNFSIGCRREIERDLGMLADGLASWTHADQTLQGWWEEEPEIGRVTTGCQHRAAQLKALGNGQVPLQEAVAFKILMGI